MVRKSIVVLLVGLVALALNFSVATAEDGTTVPCNPAKDWYCSVKAGDKLVIKHRWMACRPGLVKDFLMAIEEQEYTLDGRLLWGTEEASHYWGPIHEEWGPAIESCMGNASTGYQTYWERELDLAPGDYALHLSLWLRHPVIDGADLDGDGYPDQYSGLLNDNTVLIHVGD